jgi:hypothetical protein
VQIVMYPFMTGLVAGAFVLSSLYHVFGIKQLKDMARFALVFSLALLPAAMLPLQLHLLQPMRGVEIFMTPHFPQPSPRSHHSSPTRHRCQGLVRLQKAHVRRPLPGTSPTRRRTKIRHIVFSPSRWII